MPYASWPVANGLFYAEAGHHVLKRAIDIITQNCETNYYGHTPLRPRDQMYGVAPSARRALMDQPSLETSSS
jgi:hypothetical protein